MALLHAQTAPQPASDCFRLYEKIETKWASEPDEEFELRTEINNRFLSQQILDSVHIFGLVTSWGYGDRGENFFMPGKDLKILPEGLGVTLRYEWEPFPMQGHWRLIWEKRDFVFKLDHPFIYESRLMNTSHGGPAKDFRITLLWERADPAGCFQFLK